jgi:hypothetical protein
MAIITRLLGIASLYSVSLEAAAAEPVQSPLRNVYFGETPMHTAYSLDAYRAAKGETIVVNDRPH